MEAKSLDEVIMTDVHNNLNEPVDKYKKDHSQENYNNVLLKIFTDVDQTVIVPARLNKEKNGADLKSIYAEDNNAYFVFYTDKAFIDRDNDETFLIMTLKGVFDMILNSDVYNGVIIDPDIDIKDEKDFNQCIILKEHVITILKRADSQ
jgi:hypothetical protein